MYTEDYKVTLTARTPNKEFSDPAPSEPSNLEDRLVALADVARALRDDLRSDSKEEAQHKGVLRIATMAIDRICAREFHYKEDPINFFKEPK